MTTNNIRTATSTIVRALIDPEVATSEVNDCIDIIHAAIRARHFITGAENAHRDLVNAMTGDATSLIRANCMIEDYNLRSERAAHNIARVDEKLRQFEAETKVDINLDALDALMNEILVK